MFSSGKGGISELRAAIENRGQQNPDAQDDEDDQDEDGPLYGYIKYRRRNVILKYLPEDASRLIQGTVAPLASTHPKLAASHGS